MFLMDDTGNDNPINNNNAYDIISLKRMICLRRTLGLNQKKKKYDKFT